jgi:cyclopropane fatty-acyl-phospholipid synthase-like methyltransferase
MLVATKQKIESRDRALSGAVSRIYSFWGSSGLYDHATSLTFLFRQHGIRRRMVHRSFLDRGDRVLDLCCGAFALSTAAETGGALAAGLAAAAESRSLASRAASLMGLVASALARHPSPSPHPG